jgi:SanA protein
LRKWAFRLFLAVLVAALGGLGTSWWVLRQGSQMVRSPESVQPAQAILVLGAGIRNGAPTPMLEDRLTVALALYRAGKAPKLLLSGDHGQVEYDEVGVMRRFLEERGVPAEAIFLDHAGFDTYDSLYRSKAVFQAESLIVVTQAFHLPRALWIGKQLGVDVQGVEADLRHWPDLERAYRLREGVARLKAVGEVLIHRAPRFLGPAIPITGDGRATHE